MYKVSQIKLIIFSSIIFVLFYNFSFFNNVFNVYPLITKNILFIFSIAILLCSFIVILLSIVSSKYTIKPILIILFFISSLSNYYMNTYNIVIDDSMIQNILQTNLAESMDLISIKMVINLIMLGVIPSYIVYKINLEIKSFKQEVLSKLKTIIFSILIIAVVILSFSKFYASFFREHKPLRYFTNPTYYIYSIGKYISNTLNLNKVELKSIGLDAKVNKNGGMKRLVVMVVGETVRGDHFSLNGYQRETNQMLKQEEVFSFNNMSACGTSTAISVPCMFSIFDRDNYSYKKGISTQNVLDIFNNTKEIDVLWRDNNSDSKGVALRVTYEDYRNNKKNTICEDECRDEGMLVGLDDYIKDHNSNDIFIVLHQMGNHGPAYYKRYPKEFKRFTPECETNQLEECSNEEIINSYDNAIVYTDYFLSKLINFLKKYDNEYETAMIYMSDHGESLGENGLYLHGLPYFMAPASQTNVASVIWFGKNMKKYNYLNTQKRVIETSYSHDNLFHTLLGIMRIESDVYNASMDILNSKK